MNAVKWHFQPIFPNINCGLINIISLNIRTKYDSEIFVTELTYMIKMFFLLVKSKGVQNIALLN